MCERRILIYNMENTLENNVTLKNTVLVYKQIVIRTQLF